MEADVWKDYMGVIKMKMYDVCVWIKGIGIDSYWVEANNPTDAAIAADKRIKEETDATKWEILGVEEIKGR